MDTAIGMDAGMFARCALQCELCAEQVSSLSPDRRLPMFLRDCSHRAEELSELLDARSSRSIDAVASFLHSAERCLPLCADSIFACCRSCAEAMHEAARACEQALDRAFGKRAA